MPRVKLSIASGSSARKSNRVYPVIDDPSLLEKAEELRKLGEEEQALKGDMGEIRSILRAAALPKMIDHVRSGREETGVKLGNSPVMVIFTDKFGKADLDAIAQVIGAPAVEQVFEQQLTLSVNVAAIANSLGAERAAELAEKVVSLLNEEGVGNTVSSEEKFAPRSMTDLVRRLTPEQISELDAVYELPVMVRKGN